MDNPPKPLSDAEIVEYLQSTDDVLRKQAMYALFTNTDLQKKVFKYVLDRTKDIEIAKEVFQFALETFEKQVRSNKFEARASIHTYIVGIVKWHLLNERRKQGRFKGFDPNLHGVPDSVQAVEYDIIAAERLKILYEIIARLGERCTTLLPRWAQNAKPEDIAQEFGFSSADMAKKETYRCRVKLKAFVDERPWLKDLLKF
jgi:DNA-directed RNA polymerase specialized sigma24 family protein